MNSDEKERKHSHRHSWKSRPEVAKGATVLLLPVMAPVSSREERGEKRK